MQQYVYVMVLRNIFDCVQTVSLGWTAFFIFFFFFSLQYIAQRTLWLPSHEGAATAPTAAIKQCEKGISQAQKEAVEVY